MFTPRLYLKDINQPPSFLGWCLVGQTRRFLLLFWKGPIVGWVITVQQLRTTLGYQAAKWNNPVALNQSCFVCAKYLLSESIVYGQLKALQGTQNSQWSIKYWYENIKVLVLSRQHDIWITINNGTQVWPVFGNVICSPFVALVCIARMPDYPEYTQKVRDSSKETKDFLFSAEILSRFVVLVSKMSPLGYKRNILPSLIVLSCSTSTLCKLQMLHIFLQYFNVFSVSSAHTKTLPEAQRTQGIDSITWNIAKKNANSVQKKIPVKDSNVDHQVA